jgi:hypothetical protein
MKETENYTKTLTDKNIKEKWFVYDRENNFQIFDSEKEAYDEFLKQIQLYRDESYDDGWSEEVEDITWGKVYQTVKLIECESPEGFVDDGEGLDFAEAFAIEHRK